MRSDARTTLAAAASILGLSLLAAACGGSPTPTPAPAPDAASGEPVREAATLPLPSEGATTELPPGHPPLDSAPVATAPSGGGRLTWSAPAGWVAETPSSGMRIAQYKVAGPGGDAECVVYYFGANQGGDAMANAQRWAGQFTQPDGGSSADRMKVSTVDGTSVEVRLVEVTGTYDGGMTMTAAPAEPQPNSMLLGGIAEGPDAPWFFKLTGPEATVRAQREAFVGMMRSIRRDV